MNSPIALVLTTYNNPAFLDFCLHSLELQTEKNFEVLIADDGSGPETKSLVQKYQKTSSLKIQHFWQPDEGYQKSKINNLAFASLDPKRFPIVLCVDHDVIFERHFVEDHLRIHRASNFGSVLFMGRRIELGPNYTKTITKDEVESLSQRPTLNLLMSSLQKDTLNLARAIRIKNHSFAKAFGRLNVSDLLGSNFSIQTTLLQKINGYNEDYHSYWGEDGDLFVRARNAGAKIIGRKNFAIQYHLFHKRLEPNQENIRRYQDLLKDTTYTQCKNGIIKNGSQGRPIP